MVYSFTTAMARGVRHRLDRMADINRCASFQTDKTRRGAALLSYIFEPFSGNVSPDSIGHTNIWETQEIVRILLDYGYDVDVIDFHNDRFQPRKDYRLLIDSRRNLERLHPVVGPDCVRVHHADTSHILSQNAAELRRLLDLQQRRSVTLAPRRYEAPNLAIEHAHCATVIGNETTLATFRYADKPLYALPVPTALQFDWPVDKDYSSARKHLLWFGSGGLVRKGLDLALEAVANAPDVHLDVCGPVLDETDFANAYSRELLHTPNITLHGWVSIGSKQFREILDRCGAILFPSCSEGQAGSVATAMQAGLVPIVSAQAGIDAEPFGVVLEDCAVETLCEAITRFARTDPLEVASRSRLSWLHAREHNSRDSYTRAYRAAFEDIRRRFLPGDE